MLIPVITVFTDVVRLITFQPRRAAGNDRFALPEPDIHLERMPLRPQLEAHGEAAPDFHDNHQYARPHPGHLARL